MRASGVPEDGLFSHLVRQRSRLTAGPGAVVVGKNFRVALVTLDCLRRNAFRKHLVAGFLLKVSEWAFVMFYVRLYFCPPPHTVQSAPPRVC